MTRRRCCRPYRCSRPRRPAAAAGARPARVGGRRARASPAPPSRCCVAIACSPLAASTADRGRRPLGRLRRPGRSRSACWLDTAARRWSRSRSAWSRWPCRSTRWPTCTTTTGYAPVRRPGQPLHRRDAAGRGRRRPDPAAGRLGGHGHLLVPADRPRPPAARGARAPRSRRSWSPGSATSASCSASRCSACSAGSFRIADVLGHDYAAGAR